MTTAIAKYAARKMLNGEMDKYREKRVDSPYDPFYEMVPHPRKEGKFKKVKKQIPSYIPAHDADILAKARRRAYKLDFCLFNFLGFRFGWSSVIGLIPAIGDAIDMALAVRLILMMRGVTDGLPNTVFVWMVFNMIIDFLVGLIPFVGDLADAAIKCNSKNVRLFEEHLDKTYKPKRLQDEDNALPAERRPRPATVYEDFSDEELPHAYDDRRDDVQRPSHAHSGKRDRLPDEEMGLPRQDTQRSRRDERPSRNNTKSTRR